MRKSSGLREMQCPAETLSTRTTAEAAKPRKFGAVSAGSLMP